MKQIMADACSNCPAIFGCYYNDFRNCPRIEMATQGMGIPFKPANESYLEHIPFGVYMGLKHIVEKMGVDINDYKHNSTKVRRPNTLLRKAR